MTEPYLISQNIIFLKNKINVCKYNVKYIRNFLKLNTFVVSFLSIEWIETQTAPNTCKYRIYD